MSIAKSGALTSGLKKKQAVQGQRIGRLLLVLPKKSSQICEKKK